MSITFKSLTHADAERDDLRQALRLSPAERFRRGVALFERHLHLTNQTVRLVEDFHLNLIRQFNRHGLRYLIVGGHAVNVHGYLRGSDDFDVWLQNTTSNLSVFRQVLRSVGVAEETILKLVRTLARPGDRSVFRFTIETYNVDFLLHLDGIEDFDVAHARALHVAVGDTSIPFISLEDLIAAKQATGRLKDQLDVEKLRQIEEEKASRRTDLAE